MILIFNHNDLDGFASAAIVNKYENERCYNRLCNYKNSVPCLESYNDVVEKTNQEPDKIYIVDYSFTEQTIYQLESLLTLDIPVIWIDHHESSIEYKHPNLVCYLNTEYCGAYNTYVYLFGDKYIPRSVKLVDSWDCFKFNMEQTLEFKCYFDTLIPKEAISAFRALLNNENKLNSYIHIGSYCKKLIENQYAMSRNNCYEIMFQGYTCIMCNTFLKSSLLFDDLMDKYDIAMVWCYNGTNYAYSIYTNKDDIRCDEIAENFGGGGHKQAAGFTLDYLLQ